MTQSLPRVRFTVRRMMVAVAIAALVANRLRPIGRGEAARIAEARFLAIPGSARWDGRYEVRVYPDDSGRSGTGWVVAVVDPRDGVPLTDASVSPRGVVSGEGFAPGKFYE
jgi:hypothetical protein